MTTLREHLEAIHRATQNQDPREIENIRKHAWYALAILDDAERVGGAYRCWEADDTGTHLLIPDAEPRA